MDYGVFFLYLDIQVLFIFICWDPNGGKSISYLPSDF